jgi:hypothetical protein
MITNLLAQLKNPVLPPVLGGGNANSGGQALGKLIGNLVGALFIAGFLLTFIQLLVGGLHWITSGGDKAGLEKARDQITNAIIGIIIVAATYALTTLVGRFFGLDLKALTIPSISK